MAQSEMREFTPDEVNGPKNAMGYPESLFKLRRTSPNSVVKVEAGIMEPLKPNQPQKVSK